IRTSPTYTKLGKSTKMRSACPRRITVPDSRCSAQHQFSKRAFTWPHQSPWQHTTVQILLQLATRKTNRCSMDNAASDYMNCWSSSAGYASLAVYNLLYTFAPCTIRWIG